MLWLPSLPNKGNKASTDAGGNDATLHPKWHRLLLESWITGDKQAKACLKHADTDIKADGGKAAKEKLMDVVKN